jgi:SPOR domain
MKKFIGMALLLISAHSFSQSDTTGSVVVHKDARIDQLIKKQIEINEVTTRDSRRYVQGFRIQVINTNDRNKAMDAKTRIYQEFPELKAYLMWKAPFYKLKVGNFKDRKDADDYLLNIQRIFPAGAYVVRDVIEVNPDKSAELN